MFGEQTFAQLRTGLTLAGPRRAPRYKRTVCEERVYRIQRTNEKST